MIAVIDASIAVKWFFNDEPNAHIANCVLESLAEQASQFIVPDLFFIEVQAVLVKKTDYDQQFVSQSMKLITKLGIRTIPSMGKILESALLLACNNKISVYDGIYLALAESVSGYWLTADIKAKKRIDSQAIQLLSEYKIVDKKS